MKTTALSLPLDALTLNELALALPTFSEMARGAATTASRWRALLPLWAKPAFACDRWSTADSYYAASYTFAQYQQAVDPYATREEWDAMLEDLGAAW